MAVRKGFYRFVPILFDEETCEVAPIVYWLYPVLEFVIWFDIQILNINEFKILLEVDDGDNDK